MPGVMKIPWNIHRTTAKFSSTLSSAASPKATFTTSQLAQLDWARLTSKAVVRSSSGTTVRTGNQSRAGRHFEVLRWTVAWRSIMGPVALCLSQGRDFSQPQNQLKMAWVSHMFFFKAFMVPPLVWKRHPAASWWLQHSSGIAVLLLQAITVCWRWLQSRVKQISNLWATHQRFWGQRSNIP